MTIAKSLLSPRLVILQHALEDGNIAALEAFWREVRQQGTPLIEPIQDDTGHALVTFLWRAEEIVENVVVIGDLTGWDFDEGRMTNLPGTDLWYKTCRMGNDARTTYWLAPNDSLISMEKSIGFIEWAERSATWGTDPLNPRAYLIPKHAEDPNEIDIKKSILEMPGARPQPWIVSRPEVPKGQVECHRFHSALLDNERRIWVYTPPVYTAEGATYNLLVLFDGQTYTSLVPAPTILDNLLSEQLIPPTVTILVDSPDQQARDRELTCYPPFADFLVQELMPWARHSYHICADPARTLVGGLSNGGLAPAYVGLKYPEVFGNVLSQSGSFWWKPQQEKEYEWLARQFVTRDRLPLRFYLEMGSLENIRYKDRPTPLVASRHFRDVLQAKGYDVNYVEFSGGHDYLCWRGTLADGLLALTSKFNGDCR